MFIFVHAICRCNRWLFLYWNLQQLINFIWSDVLLSIVFISVILAPLAGGKMKMKWNERESTKNKQISLWKIV